MKKTILLILAAIGLASFGQKQQVNSIQTVVGSGRNSDYRTAVYEALVQAVSQVQGVSLQDARDAFLDSSTQLKKTKTDNSDISELRESLKQTVSAKTKGRVLSYRVMAEKYMTEMGLWFIELEAKVPGQSPVGLPPDNRDQMVNGVRSVRGNAEFNQSTVAQAGQLVAPTHSVYGKIIQREIPMDNGDKQIEYYFQLRLVELATGLQWWQGQIPVVKRTDATTPTW